MKSIITLATSLLISEAYCGFLPDSKKMAAVPAGLDITDEEVAAYQARLDDWETMVSDLEATGAINLNVFNQFHKKNKSNTGAKVGVDIEIDEIAIFFVEENLTTPYHWQITRPAPQPSETGDSGVMGNGMEYISHVFEVISTEYRPKPTLAGMVGVGGIRLFAIRGRKPGEVEVPESVYAKLGEFVAPNYEYVTYLNTDYFSLSLGNPYASDAPVWTEELEITVLSPDEYQSNLYLQ